MSPWLLVALAYLLGSIPFSYIAGRMVKGIDLREHGSGNLGATNTFRVLGAKVAAPVMLFDVLKGTLPVALFPHLEHTNDWRWQLAYGAAAIIGHVFSIYMRFKGGKGVATSAGVFLGLSPVALGVAFAVWLVVLKMTKMVSASSISGALALIVVLLIVPERTEIRILGLAVAAFVIFAHRSNVGRILRGTEPRFGAKKEPEATVAAAAVTADGEKVE
ncbi:glycerol-3-phosphate 1-O-acyltransferase PlsY [Longimicrobium terrae]|uniref:Glycerol-3-phosphate acyltransferase n=1 Tax=Longimicrobium terrae TaxID=1639882 RepID=A0A841H763_9BACT|nr:glycerol-3-phosphate acyltransferase PlsY [Longimicrobium terrae]MBB6073742.1 glycerol-3-phosphate acyltransferase PlsY [Longimicrobium terrae]NNC30683.1 glycerol-3-phosphate 1-O-acyltransferase PlsY [Longimicrobium terrae]